MGEITNWTKYLDHLRDTNGEGLKGVEAELWQDLVDQEMTVTSLQKKIRLLEDEMEKCKLQLQRAVGTGLYLSTKLVDKAKKRYAEDPGTVPGPIRQNADFGLAEPRSNLPAADHDADKEPEDGADQG